jgi:transcriptional regulator with XRE-family HTH domain
MVTANHEAHWFAMAFPQRLLTLRKARGLTQQQLADKVGVHVVQLRRYEAGRAQPTLDVLKHIAIALSVSADALVFDDNERDPSDELRLQFEAVAQLPEGDRQVIKAMIEGMIVKHETKRLVGRISG